MKDRWAKGGSLQKFLGNEWLHITTNKRYAIAMVACLSAYAIVSATFAMNMRAPQESENFFGVGHMFEDYAEITQDKSKFVSSGSLGNAHVKFAWGLDEVHNDEVDFWDAEDRGWLSYTNVDFTTEQAQRDVEAFCSALRARTDLVEPSTVHVRE